jgi:hypothetical protein
MRATFACVCILPWHLRPPRAPSATQVCRDPVQAFRSPAALPSVAARQQPVVTRQRAIMPALQRLPLLGTLVEYVDPRRAPAPAASSHLESFSATRRCALPQIENCFSVRLRAKFSALPATARPPVAFSPVWRGSPRRALYLLRHSLFRERSRRRCGRLPE